MEQEIIRIPTEGCIVSGCKRCMRDGSRGLCVNHRAIAGEKVKNGKTTWEELEKQGLARRLFTREENIARRKHKPGMKRYLPGD